MPRVSFPAAPASERKQAVHAVTWMGSFSSGMVSSRYRLCSSTSEVGVSQKSVFSSLKRSAANFFIVSSARTDWHRGMRNVGNGEQEVALRGVQFGDVLV